LNVVRPLCITEKTNEDGIWVDNLSNGL
jgi:hypothetical protein